MIQYRSAFELKVLIGELAGFDVKNIQVLPIGTAGDFRVEFMGTVAAISLSRAKRDLDTACAQLKAKYRLKD
jgi:hypothetical protein